jgi:hypothetical protein
MAHRPLSCNLFIKWDKEINEESAIRLNEEWIRLNTKACPRCTAPIEKL